MVLESDVNRHLRVNGKVDAGDTGDMPMQMGLAYYPRLFHPEARDVLVIGYGSGTTAGASLMFPTRAVTCCEIEPAVVEAGVHFSHVNHQPERSRNFRLILDDGRIYLEGCRETFDMILSEPSNPWMAASRTCSPKSSIGKRSAICGQVESSPNGFTLITSPALNTR
jgi:spermidine synthase